MPVSPVPPVYVGLFHLPHPCEVRSVITPTLQGRKLKFIQEAPCLRCAGPHRAYRALGWPGASFRTLGPGHHIQGAGEGQREHFFWQPGRFLCCSVTPVTHSLQRRPHTGPQCRGLLIPTSPFPFPNSFHCHLNDHSSSKMLRERDFQIQGPAVAAAVAASHCRPFTQFPPSGTCQDSIFMSGDVWDSYGRGQGRGKASVADLASARPP